MRTKIATVALAGALGVTGVVGATLVTPALSYAATGDSAALEDRVASLREALQGLVSDGSLTQSQADEVAATLGERGPLGHGGGHGGAHGGGHGGAHGGRGSGGEVAAAAAEALGVTEDELRAAAQDGTTLAELAEREGVAASAVVDAMAAAAEAHLDEEVAEGDLTRAEADARATELQQRLTASLDEPLHVARGHHGRPDGPGDGDAQDGAEVTPTPSAPAQDGGA